MLAALALLATPAAAATLPQWTGPGDRACAGRCPVEWALEQLPEATRADVVAAMRRAPVPVLVQDGDYLSLMTYYAGQPLAQHGVVAVLDRPEPASGWCIRGGCFVQVHGCANWAFLTNTNTGGHYSNALQPGGNETIAKPIEPGPPDILIGSAHTRVAYRESGVATGNGFMATPPVGETPAPIPPAIPLPAPFWMLAAALGFLIALRRGAGPGRRPLGGSVPCDLAGPSGPALFRGRG